MSIDNHVSIANNSYVNVGDIGDYYDGPYLLCHTDNVECCSRSEVPNGVLGEWYLPDGTTAGTFGGNGGQEEIDNGVYFFARSRGPSVVRLFRGGTPSERGRFRCEIPDADGVYKILYANICKYNMSTGSRHPMVIIDT